MNSTYYLCFSVNRLPDLTLTKYSVFDGSSVDNIMEKHGVFLRQLHRLGFTSGVYFHLLYYYNPDKSIPKGHHLSIIFYATSSNQTKLEGIREFLITSVLSNYYDFHCYEVSKEFSIEREILSDGNTVDLLKMTNISGKIKKYSIGRIKASEIEDFHNSINMTSQKHVVCEVASDADVILSFNEMPVDDMGRIISNKKFKYGAYLTKKDYNLPAQNRLDTDGAGEVMLYSIMEWEPCETGRLFNVLKLMEGYDKSAVLRIDIFPVEHTQTIRQRLPYAETRRRISDRIQGKDDNSENIVKSWDKYLTNLMKFPQFLANVVAFADTPDIAVMLADSVAAEAVESGTYLIETISSESDDGFSMYDNDNVVLHSEKEKGNYVAPFLSLYTLEEIRPMFSFPILYPGESIECQKETDPIPFPKEVTIDSDTNTMHEVISLGTSSMGYDVTFPLKLFKKHAFIAGVPGAGKTNTMLYLVTTLWRDTEQHIPFLVLEPAKQEYRALAMIDGMQDLCVFSPSADTRFPLHINPFQFPIGLTLAEHIANLNAVFAGAFELPPPSPHFIDSCIEKVYLNKGWNINERNNGTKEYPTLQELYESLEVAVKESHYQGETLGNLQSVLEVRVGSLLKREIGNVYNVRKSIIEPEDWLSHPIIIELESLGEGPANFMSLLISTLIREVLKVKKTSDIKNDKNESLNREIEHIIFYEEAHNLIGSNTDSPVGDSVDPKISATKFLVKMLAEVRALGEGIVIADQLPTVMAPEVLKNTGLKIAHRITAQDDRNLLGSTMSASPDQLEEQGTFGTGQALIFYEDLLKPFKMRMSEWEKGVSQKKYDSPSNYQLFDHLKNNETYNLLLKRSANIMQEKMRAEFDVLRRTAIELKKDIDIKTAELNIVSGNLNLLKRKLDKLYEQDSIEETKRQIADIELNYEKKNKAFTGVLTRKIKRLCWDYNNLYYAYMTLSNNYYIVSDDMYMSTIINYVSLFTSLKSLSGTPYLKEIIVEETKPIINDIKRYVDYEYGSDNALLSSHIDYLYAICDAGNIIRMYIEVSTDNFVSRAKEILQNTSDIRLVESYANDLSELFLQFFEMAKNYEQTVKIINEKVQFEVIGSEQSNAKSYDESIRKTLELDSKSLMLYKSLVYLVHHSFVALSSLQGEKRLCLLKNTKKMRDAFVKILDYRMNGDCILKDWKYKDLGVIIAIMELNNAFHYLYLDKTTTMVKFNDVESIEKKTELLREICMKYNAIFYKYSKYRSVTEYRIVLVNHYTHFLDEILSLDFPYENIIKETSRGNWSICLGLLRNLSLDEKVSDNYIISWKNTSIKMRTLLENN